MRCWPPWSLVLWGCLLVASAQAGASAERSAEHPRAAAAEGRHAHPRLSPDLWPPQRQDQDSTKQAKRGAPVRVQVILEAAEPALIERIGRHADRVLHRSTRHRRLLIEVTDRRVLPAIADLDGVLAVERHWAPQRWAGRVTSRAPRALRVAAIPPGFLLDGTGEKLGILSDSFARTGDLRTDATFPSPCAVADNGPAILTGLANQFSGDLPGEVELFNDNASPAACPQAGTLFDEGAAMAELAYDIAPAIEIAFHTAFISKASFAEGFERLCAPASEGGAGASVVVDDVLFPTQPMYQPGIVAQAAIVCVDSGVSVFSAAGNAGGNALRAPYVDVDPLRSDEFGDDFHDWGGGSGLLPIEVGRGEGFRAILQWNQPWTSLKPAGSNRGPQVDLDLYLFDDLRARSSDIVRACGPRGNARCQSQRNQQAQDPSAGQDPWEVLEFTAPASGTYYLAVDHVAGRKDGIPQAPGTPLEHRIVFLGFDEGRLAGAIVPPGPEGPALYGHAATPEVIAVGAVPWWTTPAFDPARPDSPTAAIDPRAFSARGGELPHFFDAQGAYSPRMLPLTPDIAAVDGSNNTFFGGDTRDTEQDGEPDGVPNFSGTSAAAPNAAAVALLLQQEADGLEPAALRRLLTTTAVDVTGARAHVGADGVSGAGLVDAAAALQRFPVAVAGRDRFVEAGMEEVLDGSASSGGTVELEAFAWTQVAGPEVALASPAAARTGLTVPDVAGAELVFELEVTDADGEVDAHAVTLGVIEAGGVPPGFGEAGPGAGGSYCFIATAAHGSPLAPELTPLRALRDAVRQTLYTGRALVSLYERTSPGVAHALAEREWARALVRAALAPAVAMAVRPRAAGWTLLAGVALFLLLACRRGHRALDDSPREWKEKE